MLLFALALGVGSVSPPARADLPAWLPFGRAHDLARLLPAVVNIENIRYKPDKAHPSAAPRRVEDFGSGFIVDPAGYILTNYHVVAGAAAIRVTLKDGTTLPAKVIGEGGFNVDLALLKVDAGRSLPTVRWGDSNDVQVGNTVFVVGNPLGIGESVSAGIVSALNRDIGETPYDDFIQTDAAINHGNSGGPMVNEHGDVVGVATALYSPTDTSGSIGLGFAIPSWDARFAMERLRKYHELHFGYLGMRTQTVTPDIADALDLSPPSGAIVTGVVANSPASAAGMKPGDVVLNFDGRGFTDLRDLRRMIATAPIGATANMLVWRDGRERTVLATVAKLPDEVPKETETAPASAQLASTNPRQLGLDLAVLSDAGREKFQIGSAINGVLVQGVMPDSVASAHGLVAGNVILRVQNERVSTPAEVQQQLDDARAHERHFALLLVQTRNKRKFVPMPVAGPT